MIPDHIAALVLFAAVVLIVGSLFAFMVWEVTQATDADDREGWS